MKNKAYAMYAIVSYALTAFFTWSAFGYEQTAGSTMIQMIVAAGALAAGILYTSLACGVRFRDTQDASDKLIHIDMHQNDIIHSEVETFAA